MTEAPEQTAHGFALGSLLLGVNHQTMGVVSIAGGCNDKSTAELQQISELLERLDPQIDVVMVNGKDFWSKLADTVLGGIQHRRLSGSSEEVIAKLEGCAIRLSEWRGDPDEYRAIWKQFKESGFKHTAILAWSGWGLTRRELSVASLCNIPIGVVSGSGALCTEIAKAIEDGDENRKFGITRGRAWVIKDTRPDSVGRFLKSFNVVSEEIHDYP